MLKTKTPAIRFWFDFLAMHLTDSKASSWCFQRWKHLLQQQEEGKDLFLFNVGKETLAGSLFVFILKRAKTTFSVVVLKELISHFVYYISKSASECSAQFWHLNLSPVLYNGLEQVSSPHLRTKVGWKTGSPSARRVDPDTSLNKPCLEVCLCPHGSQSDAAVHLSHTLGDSSLANLPAGMERSPFLFYFRALRSKTALLLFFTSVDAVSLFPSDYVASCCVVHHLVDTRRNWRWDWDILGEKQPFQHFQASLH